MVDPIRVDITAGVTGLDQGFDHAEKRTQEYATSVAKSSGEITAASRKAAEALGQVGREVVNGDFSRIPASIGEAALAAPELSLRLVGLLSPFAAVATAAALMGKGFYDGNKETVALSNTLITTGNAVGSTVDRLYDLSGEVARVLDDAKSETTAALTQLVRAGGVAEETLKVATRAAIDLEKSGIQAVAKTAEQFAALGKDPVEASYRLNQQYNYLTAAIYAQIKALTDEGRQRDAAALAQRTFAEAAETMAAGVSNNLGLLERGWNAVTSAITRAKSALMDLGRAQTLSEQIAELDKQIAIAEKVNKVTESNAAFKGFFGNTAQLEQLRQQRAGLLAALAAQEESTASVQAWNAAQQDGIAKLREKEETRKKAHAAEISDGQRLIEQLQGRLYTAERLTEVEKLQAQLADGKYAKITAGETDIALSLAAQIDQRELIRQQLDDELAAVKKVSAEYTAQERQLQQLIGATPTGKTQDRLQKEALAESALLSGQIDRKTFDEILENLREVKKEGKDTFGELTSAINQWGKASADAIVDFVVDGKASFTDLANSIIKDIARIVVQQNITTPFAKSIAEFDYSGFFAGLFSANADGGVYRSPGLSAYSGTIVDRPTFFPFAKGVGLMGEDGPEAILPLKEGKDGKLGIAGPAGGNVQVIINNTVPGAQATQSTRQDGNGDTIIEVLFAQVENRIASGITRGSGVLASSLEQTYGLNRAAGAF
jgi:lambda family phage tail tape measure protein